mgnify:CR=1 FL=1
MRAALLEEQGQPLVICDDIEIAGPGPGQVLVRVSHCGLCHSDLSLADGAFPVLLPIILGHEAAGRVERVGEDARGLRVVAAIDRPASRAAALLAARAVSGLSFGFHARSAHSGPQGRELIALDLIEISLVTHPLQHGARVHLVA